MDKGEKITKRRQKKLMILEKHKQFLVGLDLFCSFPKFLTEMVTFFSMELPLRLSVYCQRVLLLSSRIYSATVRKHILTMWWVIILKSLISLIQFINVLILSPTRRSRWTVNALPCCSWRRSARKQAKLRPLTTRQPSPASEDDWRLKWTTTSSLVISKLRVTQRWVRRSHYAKQLLNISFPQIRIALNSIGPIKGTNEDETQLQEVIRWEDGFFHILQI